MSANTLPGDDGASSIRIGSSHSHDPVEASLELAAKLIPAEGGLSVVFASSRYAPDALATPTQLNGRRALDAAPDHARRALADL